MAQTAMTGAAGEHFVMYRLLSAKKIAALAPTGARAVDILVCDRDGGRLASVQVKTAGSTVGASGWQMSVKHEYWRDDRLFYVFVCPGDAAVSRPACWVVPSAVVADHVRDTHQAWLAEGREKGLKRNDSDKRSFHVRTTRPALPAYGPNWLDRYREAWPLLD